MFELDAPLEVTSSKAANRNEYEFTCGNKLSATDPERPRDKDDPLDARVA